MARSTNWEAVARRLLTAARRSDSRAEAALPATTDGVPSGDALVLVEGRTWDVYWWPTGTWVAIAADVRMGWDSRTNIFTVRAEGFLPFKP